MSKKKIAASFASLGLVLTLGLSACGNDQKQSGVQSESQSGAACGAPVDNPEVNRDPKGDLPTFTGEIGEMPEMTPAKGQPPTGIQVKTLVEGDGPTIGADDTITVDYAGFLWDGTSFDSSFSRGEAATFSLNQVVTGWKYGLTDTRVGDRVEIIIPCEYGYGSQGQGNIPPNATLVFVVDVLGQVPINTDELKKATPTDKALPAGLSISGELGEEPTIEFAADAAAPTAAEVIVLAEGTGPIVTNADTVFYHMVGGYWGSPDRQSTWQSVVGQMENAGPDFAGQKVGTRLLFLAPAVTDPAMEGEDASAAPAEGSTTPASAIVVDILAAHNPAGEAAQSK